jgi:2-polyprenyl-3-methyl-5-hydroxy-6-metoxy-1,4-benzoquinol methylase
LPIADHVGAAIRRQTWARRARDRARDVAIRVGALPYRPYVFDQEWWEQGFRSDEHAHWSSIREQARYHVLLGYLSVIGGTPDIIDVACGAGLLRRRMEGLAHRTYVGIDPTIAAIRAAEAWAKEGADGRTTFLVGDPLNAALGPADVVVCAEVLYQVPDHRVLLDRLIEVVRPGGHLLTSIWRHPGDMAIWADIDRRLQRLDLVEVRNPDNERAPWGWRIACHRRP